MAVFICRVIGIVFCFLGVIGMLTPIPLGLIFFVIGLLFIVPSTPSVARLVQKARKNVDVFDKAMTFITRKFPYPYKKILRSTEVDILHR